MNKKKYKVGMYGGKFMPFHKGHLYCIEYAASQCDKLYVLLFHGGDQELRILENMPDAKWLTVKSREEHIAKACNRFNNVEFQSIDITECKDEKGDEDWDKETPLVLAVTGNMDVVYGSEPEYKEYFDRAYPWAKYEIVDVDRKAYPISGTKIRNMMNEDERLLWIV